MVAEMLEAAERFSKEVRSKDQLECFPNHRYFIGSTEEDVKAGYEAIANGEVAVIVLAGGQASRLGSDVPKGMYKLPLEDVEEPTLFALQSAQIRQVETEVSQMFSKEVHIPWIIMTSEATDSMTKKYFNKLQFPHKDLIFFKQADIPCYDLNGEIIMNGNEPLKAPNGNGGFYEAIRDILPDLRNRGVKYFHAYCVDNILCRVPDPGFIGKCIRERADCAAKVVEKIDPHEKIGIIAVDDKIEPELLDDIPPSVRSKYQALDSDLLLSGKSVTVVEYSEISKEQAEKRNSNKLYFRAGNIAIHFYHIDFLEYVSHIKLPYHIARKNIKHFSSAENKEITTPGTKLERFIFDAFPFAKNFLIYEVNRDDEFAPLKNHDSAGVDCPSSCVQALKRYRSKVQ